MGIFRKPSFADSTGDAIPFYHDGTYHIFSLTPPTGTTVYPARLRTTWSHTISKDLVHWEELETALYPGEGEDPDADGVWTGAVIHGEGKYHIFYTGYNIHIPLQQTICHATSQDSIKWVKDKKNPVIVPKQDEYESLDWRDPYVFYNREDCCYWILISARRKSGPATKRGCIVLYRSTHLIHWEHYGPIYQPYHTNCPECAEMYQLNSNWYLSYSRFSEFVNTIYRISKSPFGPWRTPKMDGIGGRRFYAAKSMENDAGRRFYFAWAHDRARNSDTGEWYWGGAFCIPHEVAANEEGELDVKMPQEIVDEYRTPVEWTYHPVLGNSCTSGDKLVDINSIGTLSYGFFDMSEDTFLFSCKIRPNDCCDQFGLLLKSNEGAARCLTLAFECGMQRVSLLNLPMDVDPFWRQSCTNIGAPKDPGPDGVRVAEKPFTFKNEDVIDVKAAIDHDMVEIFVGEKVAFTYRSFEKPEHEVGIFVQDGNAEFYDIKINRF
jgi:beta-fructofuranosidase